MTIRSTLVDSTLAAVELSLKTGDFVSVESTLIELKDLSTGALWTALKKSICAFLNSEGGYVICGIRERNRKYIITGFNENDEAKIIDLQTKDFRDDKGQAIDLKDFISFDYRSISNKRVAILAVQALPADRKYIQFDNVFYERMLTQDKQIGEVRLRQQSEYKTELEYSKEISVVENANIDDLDIEIINQYVLKLNLGSKKETIKKDINDAADLLQRKHFLNPNGKVTILGLLICGKDPARYIENRARLHCFFETGEDISRDKKFYENDLLTLADDAFAFIWGKIRVGVSARNGGSSEPEYSETLIREVINNALAHRDYSINQPITVRIKPEESVEVKNPGTFKQRMLIAAVSDGKLVRRIRGFSESKNPKLASILQTLNKIESQGKGMATLVNECLQNKTGVPYYDISIPDTISLFIPSGPLINQPTRAWLDSFKSYFESCLGRSLTMEDELVLAYHYNSEARNQRGHFTILLNESNNHYNSISSLKAAGILLEPSLGLDNAAKIYVINPELTKPNYNSELKMLFGEDFSTLDSRYKSVLNIIYRYSYFSKIPVKPANITPEVFHLEYGKAFLPTKSETLGRNIRKICVDLLKENYLTSGGPAGYSINFDFKQ